MTGLNAFSGVAGATRPAEAEWCSEPGVVDGKAYDDSYSIEGARNGEWATETAARYGADDQRGALNEITTEKTARALRLLEGAKQVVTYNMGHLMKNAFPAYRTFPPRIYDERLIVAGYTPKNPNFFTSTTTGKAGEDEWRQPSSSPTIDRPGWARTRGRSR